MEDSTELVLVLALWAGLAAIPAVIADKKGYNLFGFFFFGLFFFLPALIVTLLLQPKVGATWSTPRPQPRPVATQQIARSAVMSGPGAPPAAVRECPHCKSAMRRDASVCTACQRESSPWIFHGGHWWATSDQGIQMWLDEGAGAWRTFAPVPPTPPPAWTSA